MTDYPVDGGATSLAFGPDGAVWFTPGQGAEQPDPPGPPYFVGRMTISGSVTRYPCDCEPYTITAGPDGGMWFTSTDGSRTHDAVGRIGMDGAVRLSTISQAFNVSGGITPGPDGNVWFTEWGNPAGGENGTIGRVTPAGALTEWADPTSHSGPRGITTGSDNHLWFYEYLASKLGRSPTDPVAEPPPTTVPAATLGGTVGFLGISGAVAALVQRRARRRRR